MRRYSKRVAVATVILTGVTAASAIAIPPPPDSRFKGETNQTSIKRHVVKLSTDANGHVSGASIGWQAKCSGKNKWTDGTRIEGGDDGFGMDGDLFGANVAYTSKSGGKIRGKISGQFRGTFTDNDNASGTWKVKVTVQRKNKKGKFKTIDSCKSSITWTAARVG